MFKKYSKNFWILSFAILLFMTSFNLVLPELNNYITLLGGEDQKGLIVSLFTVSALISRPFSGKLSDLIGRKKVMFLGILIGFIVCLLYPLSFSVWFFLLLRFLHGFSNGFTPTGATAVVTDILPPENRGMGMGIWGTFISVGFGAGQSLGSTINTYLGINNLFLIAAGTTAIAAIMISYVRETLPYPQKFKAEHLKITIRDVFEPSVLPAAMVMFLTATCSGIILVITPDMSGFLELENKGYYFGIYTVSTILIRLLSSALSDRIGRRRTMIIGISFLIVSMILTAYARDITSYTVAAVIFGIATGISSPTLFAWTADLSHPERRGVGAGTMFIALEAGVFVGSFSTMFSYRNNFESVPDGFITGTVLACVSMIYLFWHLKYKKSST